MVPQKIINLQLRELGIEGKNRDYLDGVSGILQLHAVDKVIHALACLIKEREKNPNTPFRLHTMGFFMEQLGWDFGLARYIDALLELMGVFRLNEKEHYFEIHPERLPKPWQVKLQKILKTL